MLHLILKAQLVLSVLVASVGRWSLSTAIANAWADYVCRGVQPAAPATPIRISLHTGSPGTTGANEVVGGSYARQSAGYAAASGGACALAGTLNFTGMPAVTVSHIGIWDNAGSPVFHQGAALTASKTVGAGDTLSLTAATNTATGTG